MIPPFITALITNSKRREVLFPAWKLNAKERTDLVSDGVIAPTNFFGVECKCPCDQSHIEEILWREINGNREPYVICSRCIPYEIYEIDKEEIRLYAINRRMVSKQVKKPSGHAEVTTREERLINEQRISKYLHDQIFELLSVTDHAKRLKIMKKLSRGKFISDTLDIRANTVGEILNLKGNNPNPADVPQFYYNIATIPDAFYFFETFAKSKRSSLLNLSLEELYRRLKNSIDQFVDKARKPKK